MAEGNSTTIIAIERNVEALKAGRPYTHQQKVRSEYHSMEERFVKRKAQKKEGRKKRLCRRKDEDEAEYNMRALVEKEKLQFWGNAEPDIRHKYNYVGDFVGTESDGTRRFVHTKIPNLDHMRRKIQIRKLLNLSYLSKQAKRKGLPGSSECSWFREIQKLKDAAGIPTLKEKFPASIPPPPLVIPKEGILEELPRRIVNDDLPTEEEQRQNFENKRKKLYPDAMIFTDPEDLTDVLNTEAGIKAPFETPYEAAHKKNRCRHVTMKHFQQYHRKLGEAIVERRENAWCIESKEVKLPPERAMKKRIKEMAFSPEFYEVIINMRMAEFDQRKRSDSKASMYKVSCVTFRRAIFTHDWALAAKACELIMDHRQYHFNYSTISKLSFWNSGLLTLANIYKDDLSILKTFVTMARNTLGAHPSRIGIDLATWFTQKGAFLEGVNILHGMEERLNTANPWMSERYTTPSNQRMSAIKFVSELFTAVKEYATYKYNCRLYTANEFEGDMTELYEHGKFVLTFFQMLEARGDAFENDSTIFIEPMIDLTISLFGKEAAKTTFLKICDKHFHNGVLADLFLQFLLQYFPEDSEDIEKQKKKLVQYDFSIPGLRRVLRQKQFNNMVKKAPRVSSFKQLPMPGFSW